MAVCYLEHGRRDTSPTVRSRADTTLSRECLLAVTPGRPCIGISDAENAPKFPRHVQRGTPVAHCDTRNRIGMLKTPPVQGQVCSFLAHKCDQKKQRDGNIVVVFSGGGGGLVTRIYEYIYRGMSQVAPYTMGQLVGFLQIPETTFGHAAMFQNARTSGLHMPFVTPVSAIFQTQST